MKYFYNIYLLLQVIHRVEATEEEDSVYFTAKDVIQNDPESSPDKQ